MKITFGSSNPQSSCVRRIERLSGQRLNDCFQCGKCSSGCSMADSMDLLPNQVIREAQLDNTAAIMFCQAVWFCSSCFACSVRCPKGIDVSSIMEAVRTLQMTEDGLSVGELSAEDLASLPQIALVSHFRKLGK